MWWSCPGTRAVPSIPNSAARVQASADQMQICGKGWRARATECRCQCRTQAPHLGSGVPRNEQPGRGARRGLAVPGKPFNNLAQCAFGTGLAKRRLQRIAFSTVKRMVAMGVLIQHVRFGGRAWAKGPGILSIALITQALGSGAKRALCSVIKSVWWSCVMNEARTTRFATTRQRPARTRIRRRL